MLPCSEVTRLCASEEIRHAPLTRRIGVRMHLLMCRHCRRYVRELAAIGAAARQLWRRSGGTDVDRSDFERRLVAELQRVTRAAEGRK